MANALLSLSAFMATHTLVAYFAAMMLLRDRTLHWSVKGIGYFLALPIGAVVALSLSPQSTVFAAEAFAWHGSATGTAIVSGLLYAASRPKASQKH